MKTILALAAGATLATASAADARQGCGRGFHRGYYDRCIPNRFYRQAVVARPVIGIYYGNRGWWDGRHYRRDRYRWHGGWRYR